jgi:hypothetical protein
MSKHVQEGDVIKYQRQVFYCKKVNDSSSTWILFGTQHNVRKPGSSAPYSIQLATEIADEYFINTEEVEAVKQAIKDEIAGQSTPVEVQVDGKLELRLGHKQHEIIASRILTNMAFKGMTQFNTFVKQYALFKTMTKYEVVLRLDREVLVWLSSKVSMLQPQTGETKSLKAVVRYIDKALVDPAVLDALPPVK